MPREQEPEAELIPNLFKNEIVSGELSIISCYPIIIIYFTLLKKMYWLLNYIKITFQLKTLLLSLLICVYKNKAWMAFSNLKDKMHNFEGLTQKEFIFEEIKQ